LLITAPIIGGLRTATIEQVEVEHSSDFSRHGRGMVRGFVADGKLTIQGWILGNEDSRPVGVHLSDQVGNPIAEVPVDQPRPDIGEAFPEVPGASTCGIRVTLRPAGGGAGQIHVGVEFDDDQIVELATVGCEVDGEAGSDNGSPSWSPISAADRESEKVAFGRQGWLYLRRDSNDILGQQTGRVKFDSAQLAEWRRVLENRVAASKRLGVTWSCLVAADKESVYPEYLPEGIIPAARRPVHEFLDLAGEVGAPVGYALDRLLPAKRECELYARTDTHWNYRGAYIAYRALCDDLLRQGVDLDIVEEQEVEWIDAMVEGDLGSKVLPEPQVGPTIRVGLKRPARGYLVADNEVSNHGRVVSFEQAERGRTCVIFGESFANHLLPFLKETFERVVFVHTSMFVTEIIEREQAHVVLSLPLERFLIRVPDDANAFDELRATARQKGGDLPWPNRA
jgi:alginate O-acetyltransferase complex protein AlgJ